MHVLCFRAGHAVKSQSWFGQELPHVLFQRCLRHSVSPLSSVHGQRPDSKEAQSPSRAETLGTQKVPQSCTRAPGSLHPQLIFTSSLSPHGRGVLAFQCLPKPSCSPAATSCLRCWRTTGHGSAAALNFVCASSYSAKEAACACNNNTNTSNKRHSHKNNNSSVEQLSGAKTREPQPKRARSALRAPDTTRASLFLSYGCALKTSARATFFSVYVPGTCCGRVHVAPGMCTFHGNEANVCFRLLRRVILAFSIVFCTRLLKP